MREGRLREEWSQMGTLLALIANVNRDPRRCRAFKPSDFDPFARKGRVVSLKELREIYGESYFNEGRFE